MNAWKFRTIPPMYVEDVDIRGAQFLEGCLDRDVKGPYVISGVVHPVSESILSPLEVGCVLRITPAHWICRRVTRETGLALVAMTSWSLMLRFSTHLRRVSKTNTCPSRDMGFRGPSDPFPFLLLYQSDVHCFCAVQ